jgi:TonB family protein
MSHQANELFRDDLTGRVINERFRIISPLSRDASGRVYRAEQLPLGRPVAVKILDPRAHGEVDADEPTGQFQQRFLLEASVASRLQHPNTVSVFDYGRTKDGIYFIAFELVEGRSLLALVRDEGPLEASRTVHIALQIARSLREAHRVGVVHRDLKPACVLLTHHADEHDFVKLLDFGLVTHEDSTTGDTSAGGSYMGSPKYMSPEQIRGDQVDSRADVYALGVCMYEMLTGHPPFHRGNTVHILMAHMQELPAPIERSNCPPQLASLVMRCLAKNPSARPPSMDEVIVQLKQAVGRAMGTAEPMLISQEMRLPPPSEPIRTSAGSVGILASTPVSGSLTMSNPLHTPSSGRPSVPPHVLGGFTSPTPSIPPKRTTGMAKAAVVGAAVIAAGFLALRTVERERNQLPQAQAAAPSAALLAAQAPQQQPPTALEILPAVTSKPRAEDEAWVRVSLVSSPSGAMVQVFDKVYGPTPADVELWGEQFERGSEVRFVFEKDGYESVVVSRRLMNQELSLDVDMPRKAGSGRSRGRDESEPVAEAEQADSARERPYEAPYERPADMPAFPAALSAVPTARVEESPAAPAIADAPKPAPVVVAAPVPAAPATAPAVAQAKAKPTPAPARTASPAKVRGAVREGNTVFPEYPRAARRAGVSGVVIARVAVRADGTVGAVDVLEGPEVFHDSVRKALKTWRYRPAKLADGSSAPDTHVVRIPFKMD